MNRILAALLCYYVIPVYSEDCVSGMNYPDFLQSTTNQDLYLAGTGANADIFPIHSGKTLPLVGKHDVNSKSMVWIKQIDDLDPTIVFKEFTAISINHDGSLLVVGGHYVVSNFRGKYEFLAFLDPHSGGPKEGFPSIYYKHRQLEYSPLYCEVEEGKRTFKYSNQILLVGNSRVYSAPTYYKKEVISSNTGCFVSFLGKVIAQFYDFARITVTVFDPLESQPVLKYKYSRLSLPGESYGEKGFGGGTCGTMIDLNKSTTNGGEQVLVFCTYSPFQTDNSGRLNKDHRLAILKIHPVSYEWYILDLDQGDTSSWGQTDWIPLITTVADQIYSNQIIVGVNVETNGSINQINKALFIQFSDSSFSSVSSITGYKFTGTSSQMRIISIQAFSSGDKYYLLHDSSTKETVLFKFGAVNEALLLFTNYASFQAAINIREQTEFLGSFQAMEFFLIGSITNLSPHITNQGMLSAESAVITTTLKSSSVCDTQSYSTSSIGVTSITVTFDSTFDTNPGTFDDQDGDEISQIFEVQGTEPDYQKYLLPLVCNADYSLIDQTQNILFDSIQDITYSDDLGFLSVPFSSPSIDGQTCETIFYYYLDTNSDPIPRKHISIDSLTPQLQVSGILEASGTYPVTLHVFTKAGATTFSSFNLILTAGCAQETGVQVSLPAELTQNKDITVNLGETVLFNVPDFLEDRTACTSAHIKYTVTSNAYVQGDDTSIVQLMNMNPLSLKLYTNNEDNIGTYLVTIIGEVNQADPTRIQAQWNFNLVIQMPVSVDPSADSGSSSSQCDDYNIEIDYVGGVYKFEYTVFDKQETFIFEFKDHFDGKCLQQFDYKLARVKQFDDFYRLGQNQVSKNDKTVSWDKNKRKLSIYSTDPESVNFELFQDSDYSLFLLQVLTKSGYKVKFPTTSGFQIEQISDLGGLEFVPDFVVFTIKIKLPNSPPTFSLLQSNQISLKSIDFNLEGYYEFGFIQSRVETDESKVLQFSVSPATFSQFFNLENFQGTFLLFADFQKLRGKEVKVRIDIEITDDNKDYKQNNKYTVIAEFTNSLHNQDNLDTDQNSEDSSQISQTNLNPPPYFSNLVVNDKGRAVLTFSDTFNEIKTIELIDQKHLQVEVISSGEVDQQYLELNWKVLKFKQTYLLLELKFENPLHISSNGMHKREKLKISCKNPQFFKRQSDQVGVPIFVWIDAEIPAQQQEGDLLMSLLDLVDGASKAAVAAIFIGNLFLSVSLMQLFDSVNVLQLISHFSEFSASIPQNVKLFYSKLQDLSNFEILPFDQIYKFLGLEDEEETEDSQFEARRLQQENEDESELEGEAGFLKARTLILFGVALLILSIFLIIVLPFTWIDKRTKSLLNVLKNSVFWSVTLQFYFESYLALTFSAILVLQFKQYYDSPINVLQSLLSWFIIFTSLVIPVFLVIFLRLNFSKLKDKQFISKYGSLSEKLSTRRINGTIYPICFCYRRLILVVLIVYSTYFYNFQIQFMTFVSQITITMVGQVYALRNKYLMRIEYFNEITLLIVCYHYFTFSQFVIEPQAKYSLGKSLIVITLTNLGVNLILIIVEMVKASKEKLKKRIWKRKSKKQNKGLIQTQKSLNLQKDENQIKSDIPVAKRMEKTNLYQSESSLLQNSLFSISEAEQSCLEEQSQQLEDKQTEMEQQTLNGNATRNIFKDISTHSIHTKDHSNLTDLIELNEMNPYFLNPLNDKSSNQRSQNLNFLNLSQNETQKQSNSFGVSRDIFIPQMRENNTQLLINHKEKRNLLDRNQLRNYSQTEQELRQNANRFEQSKNLLSRYITPEILVDQQQVENRNKLQEMRLKLREDNPVLWQKYRRFTEYNF